MEQLPGDRAMFSDSALLGVSVKNTELITPSDVVIYILGVATAVIAQGEPRRAARLFGVLEAM